MIRFRYTQSPAKFTEQIDFVRAGLVLVFPSHIEDESIKIQIVVSTGSTIDASEIDKLDLVRAINLGLFAG